LLADQLR